jgi:hypothetical protein
MMFSTYVVCFTLRGSTEDLNYLPGPTKLTFNLGKFRNFYVFLANSLYSYFLFSDI